MDEALEIHTCMCIYLWMLVSLMHELHAGKLIGHSTIKQ